MKCELLEETKTMDDVDIPGPPNTVPVILGTVTIASLPINPPGL